MPVKLSLALVLVLILLRGAAAAALPLSADEAYYWLWSRHLAAGYFDHPPMIAWLIAAGTALFGDTPFGVRCLGLVLSLLASWFVWASAGLILKDDKRAALAVLFFNLTLMISVELLAATPDMPSIAFSAGFVYFLCQVQASGKPGYWLAAGTAAGLGLLSKFSALFLGVGAFAWLLFDRRARIWLVSPWPYLAGAVALLLFAPNLVWQSSHHWETFAYQFGRVGLGHFTLRYLVEFLVAQLGLATPLIFLLMAIGLWRATRPASDQFLLAVLVWVALAYFLEHSLHDRVQGNWPCFLYPPLAILAADATASHGFWRKLWLLAGPLAAMLLLALYVFAFFRPFHKDPLGRILGRDFAPIGEVAAAMVRAHLADAILTTDYETTAWLRFNQPDLKVVQLNEPQRYDQAPSAGPLLLKGRLIYLTELRRDQHHLVQQSFALVGFPTQLQTPSDLYEIYPVSRPKSLWIGKLP
jgi:4-amino-4-deoxy-L-arabinose transferase-like glycosyltransferase